MKSVRPTSSYQIEVPDDVKDETERGVTSFWQNGHSLALQLSSFLRNEGEPLSAKVRLDERIAGNTALRWTHVPGKVGSETVPDEAAAFYREGETVWLFTYFVWPHLTVLATISGHEQDVLDETNWARRALQSLSLIVQ
jgi:hypothetical protein